MLCLNRGFMHVLSNTHALMHLCICKVIFTTLVAQTFQSIAKEIMVRLSSAAEPGAAAGAAPSNTVRVGGYAGAAAKKKAAACCYT